MLLVGISTLSNLFLSLAIFYKNEEVILTPLEMEGKLRFQRGRVPSEYLELMGRDFARLLLDVSPASFPYNHQTILKYVAPEAYGTIQKQLLKDGEQYTSLQLSTHFKPAQITAYPETMEVDVKGILTSYITDKQVHSSSENIRLKFTTRGAGLLLESVSGGNPHAS